MNDAKLGMGPI